MATETDLYEQVAQYMNLKYPKALYHFDLSGLWTPSHKARNLYGRLNSRAWPDLFIAEMSYDFTQEQTYLGLFLELKKDGVKLYKKDGTMRANEHHEEQAKMLDALREVGYKAEFATGFDETVSMIDAYLA